MNSFYEHHKESIRWHYRCFDRMLLNGLIQPFQQPERVVGFFNTYRQLYPVTRHTLRDIAEQFQRWVKERAAKRNIPILEAPKGRRDEFVDPYFKRAKPDQLVAILKAREPARIMTAIGDKARTDGARTRGTTASVSLLSFLPRFQHEAASVNGLETVHGVVLNYTNCRHRKCIAWPHRTVGSTPCIPNQLFR